MRKIECECGCNLAFKLTVKEFLPTCGCPRRSPNIIKLEEGGKQYPAIVSDSLRHFSHNSPNIKKFLFNRAFLIFMLTTTNKMLYEPPTQTCTRSGSRELEYFLSCRHGTKNLIFGLHWHYLYFSLFSSIEKLNFLHFCSAVATLQPQLSLYFWHIT